jgi:hypothetical protein
MALDKTKIVCPLASTITIGSTDLSLTAVVIGHTDEKDIEASFDTDWKKVTTHQSGSIPICSVANGTKVLLDFKAVEFDIADIHKLGFPFATHTSGYFTQSGPASVGKKAKVLDTVRVHQDTDGAEETHDWLFNKVEILNDSVKIINKIGEKWVIAFKGECQFNDSTDMFTYGVAVP